MLQRQRLHLVEQQHGTSQRGQAPDIAPGCGKQRIQDLDHRAADHGTALPAAGVHLVVRLIPGLGYEVGVVLEHVLRTYSLPYPAGVLAGDGLEGGKVKYVPGVYAPRRVEAEAQPGVGLSRAGRQAEAVYARLNVLPGVTAALRQLPTQAVYRMAAGQRADVALAPQIELFPHARPRFTPLPLRQLCTVHEAGGVRPVRVNERGEEQALREAEGKAALSFVGVEAVKLQPELPNLLPRRFQQRLGLALRYDLGEEALYALGIVFVRIPGVQPVLPVLMSKRGDHVTANAVVTADRYGGHLRGQIRAGRRLDGPFHQPPHTGGGVVHALVGKPHDAPLARAG